MSTDSETPDALERILQLAARERKARDSNHWKLDLDKAFEEHGEAVEALHAELYRLLDERAANGEPVPALQKPPDPRKELKKQLVARLKQELPSMVSAVIDEFDQ